MLIFVDKSNTLTSLDKRDFYMQTFLHLLAGKFRVAIKKTLPDLSDASIDQTIDITQSTNEKFGHYQCNSAMKLAKIIGANPREIATKIIECIDIREEGHKIINKLEVAGPGFINISLDKDFLSYQTTNMLKDKRLGIPLPKKPQRIIVEFSSPNTAKELHVGHLRSTIIGDCIARLFEFLGHDVLRLNHVGNWGTQFGMLITYMKEHTPKVLEGSEKTNLTSLETWYKESKQQFDKDPDFKKRSQQEVIALQSGEKNALKAWNIICEISSRGYQEIYDLLGVKIEERGESFYNPMLKSIVDDLEEKGLITISDGAKCVFLEGFKGRDGKPLPVIVQKSDGGFNYSTTDIAAMRHRAQDEKADRIIVVTDAGQKLHFKMVTKVAEKAKYLNPQKTEFNHVTFGLVIGPDGKKFKTRSGETEKLIDLIYKAINRAKEIVKERDEQPEDIDQLSQKLGIGAIKYADLSTNRSGDYTFSYDKMLKFDGNTAAFIMYSYVRVAGIKRKINVKIEDIIKTTEIKIEHPSEIALAMHLLQFNEALVNITKDLLPNRLTDYLFNLANKFNAFFRDCRVIGSNEQNERLLLCELTAKVLKQGLYILGVDTVEKM